MQVENIGHKKALLMVFFPFAVGFILSCLFRTMNAVLLPIIEKSISIQINELGLLTSVYFLSHGILQIPLGAFLDKYGPRKVQVVLFTISAIGLLYFSFSTDVIDLTISHFLIGVGMAGGLMASLKIIVQWFPKESIASLNGIMMTCGGAGILLAATPTEWLAQAIGWRGLMQIYALVTFLTAMMIFKVVPEEMSCLQNITLKQQFAGLFEILRKPLFWKVAPLISTVLGCFMAIHALWIEEWMRDVENLNQNQIDNYLILIGLAMTVSLLCGGLVSKIVNRFSMNMIKILEWSALLVLVVQAWIVLKLPAPMWLLWFMYGFVSHKFSLSYAIFSNEFPKTHTGRINGALNLFTFFVAFLVQYLIGIIIANWDEISPNHYPVIAYQAAFCFVIGLQVVCYLWYAFFHKVCFRIKPVPC